MFTYKIRLWYILCRRSNFEYIYTLWFNFFQVQTDLAFSYTCPICGRLGHTILTLKDHLNQEHNNSNLEVICPICASLSDGNANQQTKNLVYHLSTKHSALISGENQGCSIIM